VAIVPENVPPFVGVPFHKVAGDAFKGHIAPIGRDSGRLADIISFLPA
jgi:hypothetical protein